MTSSATTPAIPAAAPGSSARSPPAASSTPAPVMVASARRSGPRRVSTSRSPARVAFRQPAFPEWCSTSPSPTRPRAAASRPSPRPLAPGQPVTVTLAGAGGVPAMTAPAAPTAVISNVTVTNTGGVGYIVVYPSGSALPLASDLNYVRLDSHPNHVVAKLGTDGRVTLYSGWSTSDIIVDVLGWFN